MSSDLESDQHPRWSIAPTNRGHQQTLRSPALRHSTVPRHESSDSTRIAPRQIPRTELLSVVFTILFGQHSILGGILGIDLDEPVCERFYPVSDGVMRSGIGGVYPWFDVGKKLLEERQGDVGDFEEPLVRPDDEGIVE